MSSFRILCGDSNMQKSFTSDDQAVCLYIISHIPTCAEQMVNFFIRPCLYD